jgi:hypothetical protein
MSEQPIRKQPAWLPFAVVGGAVVVIMILWAALSSPENRPPAAPKTFTLTGTLTVPGEASHEGCMTDRGYDDIKTGTGVTVYDASGKVLAVGRLVRGRVVDFRCAYSLVVSGVPLGEDFYQVEVASRGKVAFAESVLVSSGASLTLG